MSEEAATQLHSEENCLLEAPRHCRGIIELEESEAATIHVQSHLIHQLCQRRALSGSLNTTFTIERTYMLCAKSGGKLDPVFAIRNSALRG